MPIAAHAGALATVPFRYQHHEVVVPVRIGAGVRCDMLLDTDTSPSAVATDWLPRLRLAVHGTGGYAKGVGTQKMRIFPVTIPALAFGALSVKRLEALAVDLRPIAATLHTPLCGVLGASFFRARVVQIDYPRHVVRVLDDAPLEPFTAPFALDSHDQLLVRNVFVGAKRVVATIDTGDAGYGNVTARGIEVLGATRAAARGSRQRVRGYNGTASVTTGTLSGVHIGTLSLPPFAIRYNATDTAAYDVNLGNRLFERFAVTFDYQRGLLTISPSNARP